MIYVRECFSYVLFQEFYGVLSYIYKSLSHFEFISVYGVWVCYSSFIDLHAAIQLSQHKLLNRLSFPHCIFLPLCRRLFFHRSVGLFLGSLFCSIHPYFCFVPIPRCFDYCSFVVLSEVWEIYASCFVLFFSELLWQFWVFYAFI